MTTKIKELKKFAPENIELVISGAIKKNTLPAIKTSWQAWLDRFEASTLETDEEFEQAATSVKELQLVEARLADIRTSALSGKVLDAIKEIEDMQEATRQKRLEFSRAVESRKKERKETACRNAESAIAEHLRQLKYQMPNLDASTAISAAIKGKSSLASMQLALDKTVAALAEQAKNYCAEFELLRGQVKAAYDAAKEPVTDSELDLLVRNHFADAPERAKFILQQKAVQRQQAEMAKQSAPQAAAPAIPAPAPLPQTASAVPDDMEAMDTPVQHLRFGVSFDTTNPADIVAKLTALGGRNVKFVQEKI